MLLISIHVSMEAQTSKEMAYVDYSYEMVPSNDNLSWGRHHFGVSFSKSKMPNITYGLLLNLQQQQSWFYGAPKSFGLDEPDKSYKIEPGGTFSLGVTDRWGLDAAFSTLIASDFKETIHFSDLQYSGNLVLIVDIGQNTPNRHLSLGLGYGILRKRTIFYPIFSFSQSLSKKLNVELGFPNTSIHYRINERHHTMAMGAFKGERTHIHLPDSTPNDLPGGKVDLAQYALDIKIVHTYKIQPQWHTMITIGYLFDNTAIVADDHDNTLFDLAAEQSVYLSMGLTYIINN